MLLEVSTRYGTASEELRVDVTALEVPTVSIPGAEEGFTILTDSDLVLKPSVAQVSIPVSYSWSVDGREVSTERDYTFRSAEAGTYALRFAASNEDGTDTVEFSVRVAAPEDMPFGWDVRADRVQCLRRPHHPPHAARRGKRLRCGVCLDARR